MRLLASFVRVSAWERISLGRRLLCAFTRVIVLFLLVISIGYFVYLKRFQLAAELWHWRHGNETTIGNYVVPVPKHWLISDLDYEAFTLANTSPHFPKDGKFHTSAAMIVSLFQNWRVDANSFWLAHERQRLVRENIKAVEENTVKFGDESITCIGGRELGAILGNAPNASMPKINTISLNCVSERGLNVLFVGEPYDVQPFYKFLSQIRNRK